MSRRVGGIDRTLAALADPHRRHVVELLRERPHRAGELAQRTGLELPAMSRHMRQLRECGLVVQSHPKFDPRVRIYALDPKPMAELKTLSPAVRSRQRKPHSRWCGVWPMAR